MKHSILILTLFISVGATFSATAPTPVSYVPKTIKTGKFYYEIDSKRQLAIFNDVRRIRIGDSVKGILALLGKPTYDNVALRPKNAKFLSRIVKYYFKIKQPNGVVDEKYDRYLVFYFNEDGKLVTAYTNVDNLNISRLIVPSKKGVAKVGGPFYYKGWKTYYLPYRPKNEISFSETKKLTAYYEAFYTDEGKIQKFTKYFDGKVAFSVTYSYRSDNTLETETDTKSDGSTGIKKFDANENLIN